ncbi:MAG: hypothetical protein HN352_03055 [Bacteroidetes bacterium]|jgi:hypothetical protein|nr:hypothetical protein [Bacteroidota bacterium]MBT3748245.1 hypothetical protein [Bacteroidota bacterium]MBT4401071.1 hypothetical protein [Bacteroidota bacterium]MBT4408647.1 hypothetical protein [Bacteroidota bacterium]MBT5427695.1 hypothetical protein [Bacteroidota bacterium]
MDKNQLKKTISYLKKQFRHEFSKESQLSDLVVHYLITASYLTLSKNQKQSDEAYLTSLAERAMKMYSTDQESIRMFVSGPGQADVTDIPATLVQFSECSDELKELHKCIMELSAEFRKVLFYSAAGHDPKIICESLGYSKPNQFWQIKETAHEELAKKLEKDPVDSLINKLHEYLSELSESYMETSDLVDECTERQSGKTSWKLIAGISFVIILTTYIFLGTFIIPPDGEKLFNQYFDPETFEQLYADSILLRDDAIAGLSFEQIDLLLEFFEDEKLFADEFPSYKQWLEGLLNVKKESFLMSRKLLKDLKAYDIDYYRAHAKGMIWRIRVIQ